jgi:hypothetical protein
MQGSDALVRQILFQVIDCIGQIDRECKTRLYGHESGLVGVAVEFKERALKETGKVLTEERLIAWLVQQKLAALGWESDWERPYPSNRRKRCDLAVQIFNSTRLWLELKLASKAWFERGDEPVYNNSCYLSYLRGTSRSHSFRRDFEKLSGADLPLGDYRAECLVGFDWIKRPMDDEVVAVLQEVQNEQYSWEVVAERHWPDRRCTDFRINVWCWLFSALR